MTCHGPFYGGGEGALTRVRQARRGRGRARRQPRPPPAQAPLPRQGPAARLLVRAATHRSHAHGRARAPTRGPAVRGPPVDRDDPDLPPRPGAPPARGGRSGAVAPLPHFSGFLYSRGSPDGPSAARGTRHHSRARLARSLSGATPSRLSRSCGSPGLRPRRAGGGARSTSTPPPLATRHVPVLRVSSASAHRPSSGRQRPRVAEPSDRRMMSWALPPNSLDSSDDGSEDSSIQCCS